ncbi:MAG: DUF2130 domain-containing protein [Anaerolineae bacterium]|nr:DUF2130 domain-containing protein [Anaerolineae bacterium]
MNEPTITCPNCGNEFPLDAAFREHFEREVREAIATEKIAADARMAEALKERDETHERNLQRAREEAEEQATSHFREQTKALEEALYQLNRTKRELKERDEDHKRDLRRAREEGEEEAKKVQASQLEEEKRARQRAEKALELSAEERKVELQRVLAEAREDGQKENQVELEAERIKNQRLSKQMEDMQRSINQGSMELQGEALETWLKKEIRLNFPLDEVDDVQKGQTGADLVQRVLNPMGKRSGIIVWEAKNTRNWNAAWLAKARQDAERVGNALPVIVSVALPDGIRTAECIDGVWVSSMECALVVGHMLRQQLLETSDLQRAMEGFEGKMATVYAYVVSDGFRSHMERIIDSWIELSQQIETEERVMNAQWKVRRKQLERVLNITTDMHAEIRAIVGAELPQVEGLALAALPSGGEEKEIS